VGHTEIAELRGAARVEKHIHQLDITMHDAAMMRKHPEMEHDDPNMLHVAPGKTGDMGWQFTKPGEFYYGCLEPGHYEAGMVGKILVK